MKRFYRIQITAESTTSPAPLAKDVTAIIEMALSDFGIQLRSQNAASIEMDDDE